MRSWRPVVCVLLALGIWARPAPAFSEDEPSTEKQIAQLSLQQMLKTPINVWTATKTEERRTQAPAIITTVTREQIEVLGFRSIAELLNNLLGFYVVDDLITPNVAVRGVSGGLYAESSIIKVLIDGHSIAFAPTGGNWLGPELIPLSAVDTVEIIRGPASALYGPDAFLGVVNIKTRDGRSLGGGNGWLAGGVAGKHPVGDADLSFGVAHGRFDVMAALRYNRTDLSGLELPATSPAPSIPAYNFGHTQAQGLVQESWSAISRVTMHYGSESQLAVFGYFSSMERGAELGSLYQLANGYDPSGVFSENRISQWQLHAGILWEHVFSSHFRLEFRGSYGQGQPRKSNRVEVGSPFFYIRREFDFHDVDIDPHLVWSLRSNLRLVFGTNVIFDRERLASRIGIAKRPFEETQPGQTIESVSLRQGHKNFINAGGYGQAIWDVHPAWLSLTAGLRYDHHNIYGDKVSWRLGAVSSPLETLHIKLLHGTAFRAPSPLLLYAVPSAPGDVIGNPQLKPQHVDTTEVQVVYEPWKVLSLSTGLVYNRLQEKTEFLQQGINKAAQNVSKVHTISWESLLEVRPLDWLRGQASFEWQRTREEVGLAGYVGETLSAARTIYPDYMVHSNLVVQPPPLPLRLAALVSYIGPRRGSGNNALLNQGQYTLPGYFRVDANLASTELRLRRHHQQTIGFVLSGRNLTGAGGPDPGFSGVDFPLVPRTLLLQVNLRL
jgi:outer membrane receptor for ferrienterochelin and colicins